MLNNGAHSALFGSGGQDSKQLIQNVWIGGTGTTNPYKAINDVLEKLGFVEANGLHHGKFKDHQSHFHVDLRAPARLDLPEHLLADEIASEQATTVAEEALIARAQALLNQTRIELNFNPGEVVMFIADMPNIPPQELPVMIAQAGQTQADGVNTMRTIGVCSPSPNENYSLENVIIPKSQAAYYLRSYENKWVAGTDPGTITILEQPKHGILHVVTEADRGTLFSSTSGRLDPAAGLYAYLPEKGYLGDDKAVFLVEMAGVKIKVIYFFQAVGGGLGSHWEEEYCSETGYRWKISATLDADGNSSIAAIDTHSPTAKSGSGLAS